MHVRLFLLIALAIAIPLGTWFAIPYLPSVRPEKSVFAGGTHYPASPVKFEFQNLGGAVVDLPLIANVQVIDFDQDGRNDVIACDARGNRVLLLKRNADDTWSESTLISDVAVPAHATVVDIDHDGDQDVIVSVLGNILPDDGVIGRVELFENQGEQFVRHVVLDDVRRVADVQVGDFDGDDDLDLAVAVFGYARGGVLWLENQGNWKFRDHQLLSAPGTIHVPVGDFDGDGDLDISAIVTQDEEELWGFENQGDGKFAAHRIWMTSNLDLGGAGLVAADLDSDGDLDLVLPAGDNLEDFDAYPQPYHGCYWFENQGKWEFAMHRISDLGGAYSAAVADINQDGFQDVVLVSLTNDWLSPENAAVVWLQNDGKQKFQSWQIASQPLHLVTVAVGDLNGDDRPDIVAGSLNVRRPHQRLGRISAWLNQGDSQP
ncbi:VCBS repeat-containing protein [Blastopirellula sp. JC732]|uniref:VCBS repeat-containing protein n=1 Tax=Blastopirellula sediminis TaxID=2894196 RepID=A0A9X1MKK1_9BACT|nr:VCBS repeat-containing protein [Blastopirellula sediminis]MCC9608789.1 VCBS repeat-containing protein [Blastopirellula sediminis]MCC9628434.1 VCBS repeat-containing protein [Blastopirellula sediminis]